MVNLFTVIHGHNISRLCAPIISNDNHDQEVCVIGISLPIIIKKNKLMNFAGWEVYSH